MTELIESHIERKGSQSELKKRVDAKLGRNTKKTKSIILHFNEIDDQYSELIQLDEFDSRHLLWEEVKGIVHLMG